MFCLPIEIITLSHELCSWDKLEVWGTSWSRKPNATKASLERVPPSVLSCSLKHVQKATNFHFLLIFPCSRGLLWAVALSPSSQGSRELCFDHQVFSGIFRCFPCHEFPPALSALLRAGLEAPAELGPGISSSSTSGFWDLRDLEAFPTRFLLQLFSGAQGERHNLCGEQRGKTENTIFPVNLFNGIIVVATASLPP